MSRRSLEQLEQDGRTRVARLDEIYPTWRDENALTTAQELAGALEIIDVQRRQLADLRTRLVSSRGES